MHAVHFGGLIGVDIRGEPEDHLVLRRAVGGKKRIHHRQRALMMLDHIGEKEPVERGALRAVQLRELSVGEHARHQHVLRHAAHHHMVVRGVRVGDDLAMILEPPAHGRDLVPLAHDNALTENLYVWAGTVSGRPGSNQHCLRMVGDHPRHEVDVGLAPGRARGLHDRLIPGSAEWLDTAPGLKTGLRLHGRNGGRGNRTRLRTRASPSSARGRARCGR